jgi:hypothetical protein
MQSNNVVQFPWQLTCQTVFQQALQVEGLVAASLEEYSAPFSQADFNHLSHTIQSADQSSILYSTLQKFAHKIFYHFASVWKEKEKQPGKQKKTTERHIKQSSDHEFQTDQKLQNLEEATTN